MGRPRSRTVPTGSTCVSRETSLCSNIAMKSSFVKERKKDTYWVPDSTSRSDGFSGVLCALLTEGHVRVHYGKNGEPPSKNMKKHRVTMVTHRSVPLRTTRTHSPACPFAQAAQGAPGCRGRKNPSTRI